MGTKALIDIATIGRVTGMVSVTRIVGRLRLGEIAEIGRIGPFDNAQLGLADLEAGQCNVRVYGDGVFWVRHVDLCVGGGDRILHHHQQGLRVEGIFLKLEFGRELPLIADDRIEAAVGHGLRFVVELVAEVGV